MPAPFGAHALSLGVYLRTRREGVTPAEVGLPGGGRRRTPGLRRAELATLAGISVEYLVRLEQGRDRHPSAQVLAALANVLGLSADERLHLHLLVKATGRDGQLLCPAAEAPARSVRPTVQALLDRLEPTPAFVVNRLTEVLAFTTGFARLAGPVGLLDAQSSSLARFVFTDARARAAYPDWDRVADEQAANLKLESARADSHVAELVDELIVTAGASFTDRLQAPRHLGHARPPRRTPTWRATRGGNRLTDRQASSRDRGGRDGVPRVHADDGQSRARRTLATICAVHHHWR